MKDKLEKVLFELKSAELIIEILQKERELYKMEEGRSLHQITETKVQLQDALSHGVLNDQCYHSEKRGQPIPVIINGHVSCSLKDNISSKRDIQSSNEEGSPVSVMTSTSVSVANSCKISNKKTMITK
jgi:hypothetical protein